MTRTIPHYSALFGMIALCGSVGSAEVKPRPYSSPFLEADLFGKEARAADHRDTIDASVIMHNGSIACSATIFSARDKAVGMGCAHCFTGRIGGKFWVSFTDSSHALATLVAYDRGPDLALFTVDAESILAVAPLPAQMPAKFKAYESIGYPHGRGPVLQTLHVNRNPVQDITVTGGRKNRLMERWAFIPQHGTEPGHSGSGVFADGKFVAVTNSGASGMFASPHSELVSFVKKYAYLVADCGPLFDYTAPQTSGLSGAKPDPRITDPPQPGEAAAPPARPQRHEAGSSGSAPIQPIFVGAPVNSPNVRSAPPPPEDESAPPPPNWHADPNGSTDHGGDVYAGHGRLPKRLRGIKTRAGLLDKAIHDVDELENDNQKLQAEIDRMKGTVGQPGPAGPRGQDGAPAPLPPPPPAVVPETYSGPPLLLLGSTVVLSGIAFVSALLLILVIGKLVTDSRAAFAK